MSETREFAYTREDFERVRKLIHGRAGIALAQGKGEMVYSRVAKRVRALNLDTFSAYLAVLDDDLHPEWEHFVNALTTNQTDFFREAHHFPILVAHALAKGNHVRVWSAASSTGEEPYSIAMALCEAFGTFEPPVRILATDLDSKVLATGSAGIYPMERAAPVDEERLKRFFLRGKGEKRGFVRVREELRALIEFRQLNLRDVQWDIEGPFDAIFCRNVLIYFDKPTQRAVLERLVKRLAADGLYFAGHSESLLHASDLLAPRGRTVYSRASHPGRPFA
ncbi:Chemotaxis protein methyltransferase [Usitatibacter rugosus]|uniref:Chemotaxis protein methyltransferase n=1 Tax=Usitatibacter rugosus TaxID=2732067 RepID=A0A6M4GUC5_9PROT|nr:CheR family methyltransferase [Usitatibacter rugosus]QJR10939.1 Chemotaxis protein methyltransferase [Usitatibacter rugosus]